jgi:hypothetical protein
VKALTIFLKSQRPRGGQLLALSMASSPSPSFLPYPLIDPQTVQAFARTAQLELLDFVRSMIEQRRLRDPMGGKARAGDKFMVEVDQFVIGLREPQFEKCK